MVIQCISKLRSIQIQMFFIHIFTLCYTIAALQFHFDRSISLILARPVQGLTALNNGAISIQTANIITILNGTNFENKVAEIQADSATPQLLVTAKGEVFINNGAKIIEKIVGKNESTTVSSTNLKSNMILTDKYALIGQRADTPILKRLNLQTYEVETFTFDGQGNLFDYDVYLNDLKNGQIIFGEKSTLYLANNQTFEVDETFTKKQNFTIYWINSYWSQKQKQGSIVVGYTTTNYFSKFDENSKKLNLAPFYNPSGDMVLTSPTSAVSLRKNALLHWQNFGQELVAVSWDKNEYMGYMEPIALSNSEQLIAMNYYTNYSEIIFLTLAENNTLSINSRVKKQIENSIQSGAFTEDDSSLIFSITQQLRKMDMTSFEETAMMDGDNIATCLTYLLIKNRVIAFISRKVQKNTQYYLHLRDAADFSQISQLQVTFTGSSYDFKLLGNQYWNSSFLLLIKTVRSAQNYSSKLLQFSYFNDEIVLLDFTSDNFAFPTIYACRQYLINIPKAADNFQVYYGQNMTLIKKIPNILGFNSFKAKDRFLIAQYQDGIGTYFFDFSLQNWEKGLLYQQYYSSAGSNFFSVLFPRRNLYLLCNSKTAGTYFPNKLIYNLNKIPINKISTLPATSSARTSVILEYTSKQAQSCIYVFLCSNFKLYKYDECNSTNSQVVTLRTAEDPRIFISTNQKYLIFVDTYSSFQNDTYTVEVRLVKNISILVLRSIYIQAYNSFRSIDITKDERLIMHFVDRIMIVVMELEQDAVTFNLDQINQFDVSPDRMIAITGESQTQGSSVYPLIVKSFGDHQILLSVIHDSPIKIVKLSQKSTKVVAYDSNSKFLLWNIQDSFLILSQTIEGVLDIKFINQNTVLLQLSTNISIISFKQNQIKSNIKEISNFTKTAINKNNNLIAGVINNKIVKVFDLGLNEIATFTGPTNDVAAVDFTSNDEVYAVTLNGTLLILSPTPCPASFINVESICICSQNATNITGACACKENFIQKDNACLCQNGFSYDQNNCFCNSNASIIGNMCKCKENYSFQDNTCLCTNGFTLEDNKCFCNSNASIVGSSCTCRQNFMLIDNTCVCELIYSNGECVECSFMCNSCDGAGAFDCTSFSQYFYIIIAGSVVVLATIIIVIVLLIRKKKKKLSILETHLSKEEGSSEYEHM